MCRFRTLIVDDTSDANLLAQTLERCGVGPTRITGNAIQAVACLRNEHFDAVVTEVALPGMSGIQLLERVNDGLPVVVVSWLSSPAILARAAEAGAAAFLTKPCDEERLVDALRSAVTTRCPVHAPRCN